MIPLSARTDRWWVSPTEMRTSANTCKDTYLEITNSSGVNHYVPTNKIRDLLCFQPGRQISCSWKARNWVTLQMSFLRWGTPSHQYHTVFHQWLQWLVCALLGFCSGLFWSSLDKMGCRSREEEALYGNILAWIIFVYFCLETTLLCSLRVSEICFVKFEGRIFKAGLTLLFFCRCYTSHLNHSKRPNLCQ